MKTNEFEKCITCGELIHILRLYPMRICKDCWGYIGVFFIVSILFYWGIWG